jgi:hypothetical protein
MLESAADEVPTAPYISVVVTARNDDHGGNMLGRMQAFLYAWSSQAKRYKLPSEIVIVEWNAPSNRPKLIDALQWPANLFPCEVRFIEVPAELHSQFPNAGTVPLHQMAAKNVGIRRARGEFVLATNIDIVLSANLMQFLAERRLKARQMFRVNRHDVASEIPGDATVDELLAFCHSRELRVFAREGTFELAPDGMRVIEKSDIVAPDAGIRLGPGWFPVEFSGDQPLRWIEKEAEIVLQRPEGPESGLAIDVEIGPSAGAEPLTVEILNPRGDVIASVSVDGRLELLLHFPEQTFWNTFRIRVHGGGVPLALDARLLNLRVFGIRWVEVTGEPSDFKWSLQVLSSRPPVDWNSSGQFANKFAERMRDPAYLHTNACGDFTLLSRDDWVAVRGYPEFPVWPMHIDALVCYTAYHAGIHEIILEEPMRVFHIQHFSGAGWTPEGDEERTARIERKRVPQVQYSDWVKLVDQMRRFNAPMIFNGENWGLGNVALRETDLSACIAASSADSG